jgi:hypothetical protein
MDNHICIFKVESPTLFEILTCKEQVLTHILKTLFCELINVLKNKKNSLDLVYGNDACGHAIILPREKMVPSMEKVQKRNWAESMLEHIAADACDKDDAAEYLCCYIGKSCGAPFTLASKSLGYPLVQGLN